MVDLLAGHMSLVHIQVVVGMVGRKFGQLVA